MADELLGPETAKAVQKAAGFGTKLAEMLEKAETLPKVQAFFGKVVGAPLEDLTGLMIGDPIRYIRFRGLLYYQAKVDSILEQRGVKEPQAVSPSIAVPLIEAATNETREELCELWAKLLAAAMDPKEANHVRLELIDAVKRLAPIDARVLEIRHNNHGLLQPSTLEFIARIVCINIDEVQISVTNLVNVHLMLSGSGDSYRHYDVNLSPLGRELMRLVS